MTETAESLMERAAAFLEGQAGLADQGPWKVTPLPATCAIHTGEGSPYPGDHLANVGNRYNAGWIATMSPTVSVSLVGWLRWNARKTPVNQYNGHALDFARTVLGVPLEQEET